MTEDKGVEKVVAAAVEEAEEETTVFKVVGSCGLTFAFTFAAFSTTLTFSLLEFGGVDGVDAAGGGVDDTLLELERERGGVDVPGEEEDPSPRLPHNSASSVE